MRIRPWVMLAIHANALCHLGAARTLSLLQRFYWWVGMNEFTRFWIRKWHMWSHILQGTARLFGTTLPQIPYLGQHP